MTGLIASFVAGIAISSVAIGGDLSSSSGYRPDGLRLDFARGEAGLVDPRPMTSQDYPWSAIGKFVDPDGGVCTGTMVASNLVLTSGECVSDWEESGVRDQVRFYPNFRYGAGTLNSAIAEVYFAPGGYNPRAQETNWAIVRLNSLLGLKTGWMGWRVFPNMQNNRFAYAAYSSEFLDGETAGTFSDCLTVGDGPKMAQIACRLGSDEAGGPVFAQFDGDIQLVGLATGYGQRTTDVVKAIAFSETLAAVQGDQDLSAVFTNVCNRSRTGAALNISLAFLEDDGSYTSQGWYLVEPERCLEVYLRDAQGNHVTAYAAAETIAFHSTVASRSFCVQDAGSFRITEADARNCRDDGERLASFSQRLDGIGPTNLSIFDLR